MPGSVFTITLKVLVQLSSREHTTWDKARRQQWICMCFFFSQQKILNTKHFILGATQRGLFHNMWSLSTRFTSVSLWSGWISSAEDKEALEDNVVFLHTVSLTSQHCLNVISSGHLSDTQHPEWLLRKKGLKTSKLCTRIVSCALQHLSWPSPLKTRTCQGLSGPCMSQLQLFFRTQAK